MAQHAQPGPAQSRRRRNGNRGGSKPRYAADGLGLAAGGRHSEGEPNADPGPTGARRLAANPASATGRRSAADHRQPHGPAARQDSGQPNDDPRDRSGKPRTGADVFRRLPASDPAAAASGRNARHAVFAHPGQFRRTQLHAANRAAERAHGNRPDHRAGRRSARPLAARALWPELEQDRVISAHFSIVDPCHLRGAHGLAAPRGAESVGCAGRPCIPQFRFIQPGAVPAAYADAQPAARGPDNRDHDPRNHRGGAAAPRVQHHSSGDGARCRANAKLGAGLAGGRRLPWRCRHHLRLHQPIADRPSISGRCRRR
jgi:hypothetical protein